MKHFNPTVNPFNGVDDYDAIAVIQRPLGINTKELTPENAPTTFGFSNPKSTPNTITLYLFSIT
ncbi:hypothetical protein GCM10011507_18410 [Edaphobacter acidisoli]|uniref:Uncharacterized protein n=1 Tax=Edaphobacter acidisoli TaxID=2040573 RepID=A0A916W5F6_9BACT|nr:hypothetical protein GCM10011507_18410 [Edaphobacter acidisoli]